MVICIVIVNTISVIQRSIDRSSHRRFSIKKLFLQISQNSHESTCARQSLFFKRLYYRFFSVNFPKFVGPLYLQNTFGRLLLHLEPCQISMIELFCGNSKSFTVFEKKPSYMFKRVLITHCQLYLFMEIFFMHCIENYMKIQQQSFTNVLKSRCS